MKSGFQVSAGKSRWQGYFFKNFNIIGGGAKTSLFCVANFPMKLTKLHYTCSIKSFQREVFRRKFNFFMNLEYWLNSSSVSGIFFRWTVKLANYVSVGKLWRNNFLKHVNFFMKYGHWVKNCRHLVDIFPKGLPKLHFTCYKGQLGENNFSNVFKHFRTWSQKVSAFFVFFSACLSKQQSTYPEEQFDEKPLFEKSFLFWSFSDNERKNFRPSGNFFSIELSKLLATCPSEFLEEKNLWKNFFCHFWFLNENFLAFCRIFFRGVVKTAIYVSIGKTLRKKNFILSNSHKQRTFLAFGWNLSDWVFKTSYYVFIKTLSEEKFLEKIFVSS